MEDKMPVINSKIISMYIIFLSLVLIISCGYQKIDGDYKLVEGDCPQFLKISNLGSNTYNIILKGEDNIEFDALGKLSENNIIFLKMGTIDIEFEIKENKVVFNNNDKKCTFERTDKI